MPRVLRARVERANIEPEVIQARTNLDIALLELKRLTNVPAATPVKLTTRLTPETVQATVVGMMEQSTDIDARPSVQAAKFTAEARRTGACP